LKSGEGHGVRNDDGQESGRSVGVAATTGDTPNTIEAMADHAVALVGALGLSQVDVLGFSIGGYVAQTLALSHRTLVAA
jgi:pimeloyl-ACP methyl ester carboxylesterase